MILTFVPLPVLAHRTPELLQRLPTSTEEKKLNRYFSSLVVRDVNFKGGFQIINDNRIWNKSILLNAEKQQLTNL